jgi:hypothetical protein
MTPSMLVKLKDLRSKEKIIFIIATNYAERIDMAIKRKGRIDEHYLVLPPDLKCRGILFKELIIDKLNAAYTSEFNKYKDLIIKRTALFTYTEFKQLADVIKNKNNDLVKDGNIDVDGLNNLIEKPAITLISYKDKLGIKMREKNVQKPIKEFLSLVFLKAEAYDSKNSKTFFDDNELDLLLRFFYSKEILSRAMPEEPKEQLTEIIGSKDKLFLKLKDHINEDMFNIIIEALGGIK